MLLSNLPLASPRQRRRVALTLTRTTEAQAPATHRPARAQLCSMSLNVWSLSGRFESVERITLAASVRMCDRCHTV